ncbi:MAG: hypothetical protein HYX24_04525 [Candidatus Aenigmarchaeota archaeon]|nr:hypothetical protein [Candidatus Aenigmarchaeota archaeon]
MTKPAALLSFLAVLLGLGLILTLGVGINPAFGKATKYGIFLAWAIAILLSFTLSGWYLHVKFPPEGRKKKKENG